MSTIVVKRQSEFDAIPDRVTDNTVIKIDASRPITVDRNIEGAEIHVTGFSLVVVKNDAAVIVLDCGRVSLEDEAVCLAFDRACVEAHDRSCVEAYAFATVFGVDHALITLNDNATGVAYDHCKVTLNDRAEVLQAGTLRRSLRKFKDLFAFFNSETGNRRR